MKFFLLFINLFYMSYFCYSQDSKFTEVMEKLKTDEQVFLQFRTLGEKHCANPMIFEDEYIKSYNSMDVITRLINQNALKNTFQDIEKGRKNKKCNCLYQRKNKLRKKYYQIISNKSNYNNGTDYDLEKYMQGYLELGYIKVDSK